MDDSFVIVKPVIERSRKYFTHDVHFAWLDIESMYAVFQKGSGKDARIAGYWNTESQSWQPYANLQDMSTLGIPDRDLWGQEIQPHVWLINSGDYGLMPDFQDKTKFKIMV